MQAFYTKSTQNISGKKFQFHYDGTHSILNDVKIMNRKVRHNKHDQCRRNFLTLRKCKLQ